MSIMVRSQLDELASATHNKVKEERTKDHDMDALLHYTDG